MAIPGRESSQPGQEDCRDLVLQISTKADPENVRGMLPQAARAGASEVGSSAAQIIARALSDNGPES
jgi:hypothetical protein